MNTAMLGWNEAHSNAVLFRTYTYIRMHTIGVVCVLVRGSAACIVGACSTRDVGCDCTPALELTEAHSNAIV